MVGASRLVSITLLVCLGGCVAMNSPPYPEEWAAPDTRRIGDCPALAGEYRNAGRLALVSGVQCPTQTSVPGSEAGEWNCSLDLSDNLGVAASASTVELRQPDDRALEVVLDDATAGQASTHMLRRDDNFSCESGRLYFGGSSSALGNSAYTAVGAMVLSGGVLNHSRAFSRAQDGALVMTVTESKHLFAWGMPAYFSYTSHVRWEPAPDLREEGR